MYLRRPWSRPREDAIKAHLKGALPSLEPKRQTQPFPALTQRQRKPYKCLTTLVSNCPLPGVRSLCQNMAVSLATASQPALDRQKASCQQRYKIHVKRAIGVVRDHFVGLVAVSAERWEEIMNRVSLRMLRAASVVRAGRSFERRTPRRLPPAQPYKPIT